MTELEVELRASALAFGTEGQRGDTIKSTVLGLHEMAYVASAWRVPAHLTTLLALEVHFYHCSKREGCRGDQINICQTYCYGLWLCPATSEKGYFHPKHLDKNVRWVKTPGRDGQQARPRGSRARS